MFKKFKYLNAVCVIMIFSILALALAIGFVAVSALKNESVEADPLDGFKGEYKVEENKSTDSDTSSGTEDSSGLDNTLPPENYFENEDDFWNKEVKPYSVYSNMRLDRVYLRIKSFGDYDGRNWSEAVPYTDLIDGVYPASFLSAKYLETSGESLLPIFISVSSENPVQILPQYMIPHAFYGNSDIDPIISADDINPAMNSGIYYTYMYNYDDISVKAVTPSSQYVEYEKKYRDFVYENYLSVNDDIRQYMSYIITEQGFDPSDENIAVKVQEYISNCAKYGLRGVSELESEENIVIAFMETYKVGVCRHFAAAATMMFRTLGIPARYTAGFLGSTNGAEETVLTTADAHAWVEIYVDGFGWKMVEVTGTILDDGYLDTDTDSDFETYTEDGFETGSDEFVTDTETESDSETETESDSETETESDSETETESDSETETESDSENATESSSVIETEFDSEFYTGPGSEFYTETDSDTESKTETETETQTQTEFGSELDTESGSEIYPETGSDTETETEIEIESDTESGTEFDTESETVDTSDTQDVTASDTSSNTETSTDNLFENEEEVWNSSIKPYHIYSDKKLSSVYLRIKSYGNYDGSHWSEATPYTQLIDGKYPASYLGVRMLEESKATSAMIVLAVNSKNPVQVLPQYMVTNYSHSNVNEAPIIPANDVSFEQNSGLYVSYMYNYNDISVKAFEPVSKYAIYEAKYRNFVYDNYLDVNEDVMVYMQTIIDAQGFDVNDEDIAAQVKEYISSCAEYNNLYADLLDMEENIVISFMEDYKSGVCRHFATAATMMFRTLGIPARYTIGLHGQTDGVNYSTLTEENLHAWVEIYVDGFGWKMVEVTPGFESSGEVGDNPGKETNIDTEIDTETESEIETETETVTETESDTDVEIETDESETDEFETYESETDDTELSTDTGEGSGDGTGEGTGEGPGTGTGEGPGGETETETGNPDGKPQIVITPKYVDGLYNGEPIVAKNQISYSQNFQSFLNAGYSYEVKVSGSRTEPGLSSSQIDEFVIYDPDGVDVTEEFYVVKKNGSIHVYLAYIRLNSEDLGEFVYSGKPVDTVLEKCYFEILDGEEYISGYTITMVASKYMAVNIGESDHKFDVVITDDSGNVVSNNYFKFYSNFGKVSIVPRSITVETASDEKVFDGTPLVNGNYWVVESDDLNKCLVDGHKLQMTVTGSMSGWGSAENTYDAKSIKILDSSGDDVTGNYKIVVVCGTLFVKMSGG